MIDENWEANLINREDRKRASVKLMIDAQETLLLEWPAAHEKKRIKLLTALHQAADDVREAWGSELSWRQE